MFGGASSSSARRRSLDEMEKSLEDLKRRRAEFERSLAENPGMLDDLDPLQNEMYALALYTLWEAFSEAMQMDDADFGLESRTDAYALNKATKFEREACARFGL